MGCSTGNALEEKKFQKTGNPKRDFFYCFDDEEIKIIEERRKEGPSSSPDMDYMDLYSRFEIDYTKEKDENLILKQYIAVYAKKDYSGAYVLDDIQYFHIEACEIVGFKINDKEATLPTLEIQNNNWIYCGIKGQISENNHEEPFKDLLILEITYKIKQYRLYNTRYIMICHRDDPYTTSIIIYYDKNKMEVVPKVEENLISLKNGVKLFNQRENLLWVRKKGKIQFNKEEEALIKKKFTSEEISNIYTALDKIGPFKENDNLIFEKFKYTFSNRGISKGEGKMLIITNDRLSGSLNGCDFNLTLTELKVNDKAIERKPEDFYEENQDVRISYFKSDNGANNTHLDDLKPLVIIEFKIELVSGEEKEYPFGFKNLFGVDYLSGGYYNYEIIPNDAQLIYEPDEERYKPKKTRNSISYSGFYDVNLKEYDDNQYIRDKNIEYDNEDDYKLMKDQRMRDWMVEKLEEFHPLKIKKE